MRFFVFTFIVYLLLLSWQPCQDLATNNNLPTLFNKTEQIYQTELPEESEDCSPFCVCSCCHIFTVSNLPDFTVKNKYTIAAVHISQIFYRDNYSQQLLSSIWQPPKFNFTA